MANESNTVNLHRVLRAKPERVYKAFLDPDALVKWITPFGFTGKVHHMDTKVGGGYQMSFTNFGTGKSHSFGCKFVEMIPNQMIRYIDKFDDPHMPDEMQVTVILKQLICGTEISITQKGIPLVIPVELCYLGWQESLAQLAHLVEPEIPDGG